MEWFDLGELTDLRPADTHLKDLETQTAPHDVTGIRLVTDLGLIFEIWQQLEDAADRCEVVVIEDTQDPFGDSIGIPELRILWYGYDILDPAGGWSLIYEALFEQEEGCRQFGDMLNGFGLLDADELEEFIQFYIKMQAQLPVEEISCSSEELLRVRVGRLSPVILAVPPENP